MHDIEPFYGWREYYRTENDKASPFYGAEHSEFQYENKIYNYYVHPQWDGFGPETLMMKVIYADYSLGFVVIEFIGEWNDCLHNDVMFLKRDIVDEFSAAGINHFIVIGENVLNFHASDDSYYEEWFDDIKDEGGWIAYLNFREHVVEDMQAANLHHYISMGGNLNDMLWRKLKPAHLFHVVDNLIIKALVG